MSRHSTNRFDDFNGSQKYIVKSSLAVTNLSLIDPFNLATFHIVVKARARNSSGEIWVVLVDV